MQASDILAPLAAPARVANWTKWLNQLNPFGCVGSGGVLGCAPAVVDGNSADRRYATRACPIPSPSSARSYATRTGNWGLVAAAGEFERIVLRGYGNASQAEWWRGVLGDQLASGVFTASGNYQDHSGSGSPGLNPLPYDT